MQIKYKVNDKLNIWAGTNDIDYTDTELGIARCFKWLVPKLQEMGLMLTLSSLGSISGGWSIRLHKGYFPNRTISYTEAETPALTLCLAIKKLIKEDRKVG